MNLTWQKIISFILNPTFPGWVIVLKTIFILTSLVFLGVIIFALIKTTWLKRMIIWDVQEFLTYRELKEKLYHLKLMRESAPGLLIKASSNIKTLKDVKEAIKAGADIIGTSSSVEIMKQI